MRVTQDTFNEEIKKLVDEWFCGDGIKKLDLSDVIAHSILIVQNDKPNFKDERIYYYKDLSISYYLHPKVEMFIPYYYKKNKQWNIEQKSVIQYLPDTFFMHVNFDSFIRNMNHFNPSSLQMYAQLKLVQAKRLNKTHEIFVLNRLLEREDYSELAKTLSIINKSVLYEHFMKKLPINYQSQILIDKL